MARRRTTKRKTKTTGASYRVKATNKSLVTKTVASCTTKAEANRIAKELRAKHKGWAVFVQEC